MGTKVAVSFTDLRTQLENEKTNLFKIDENIKKIVQTTGRFNNDRFNNLSGEYGRGGLRVGGGRNSFTDIPNHYKNDEFTKRKHETKTVFSRLSARMQDSDGEEDGPGFKRSRVSSTVNRELPTRAAVLQAQGDDEQSRKRNRRIFGSLLGTLQKFKQEEIGMQTKEEKKAQVERKIEEQARLEKEKEQKERKTLFAEREHKKATIKTLEAKMARVQEFEKWETSQQSLTNFILTKAKPHIYWLPKRMSDKASEKLNSSRKFHERCMTKKRLELEEELQRIEQRCLRIRAPGAKENDPATTDAVRSKWESESSDPGKEIKLEDDKSRKRDKFAMDVDEKEDTDGDEGNNENTKAENNLEPKHEKACDENKMDMSEETNHNTSADTAVSVEAPVSVDAPVGGDAPVSVDVPVPVDAPVPGNATVPVDAPVPVKAPVPVDAAVSVEAKVETQPAEDTSLVDAEAGEQQAPAPALLDPAHS